MDQIEITLSLQTVFVFLVFFDRLAVKLDLRVVAHNR